MPGDFHLCDLFNANSNSSLPILFQSSCFFFTFISCVFHLFSLFVKFFFFMQYILPKLPNPFNWGSIIYSYSFFPKFSIKLLCSICFEYQILMVKLFILSYLLNLWAFSCIFFLGSFFDDDNAILAYLVISLQSSTCFSLDIFSCF